MGAPENASLSCVRKPSLEATPNEPEEADPRLVRWEARDAIETVDPDVAMGWTLPFDREWAGVGTSGGSCFVTEKERIVSTPPLCRARETKHVKCSMKYLRSLFIVLKPKHKTQNIES